MRIHHWQTALVEVLHKYRDQPFKWGEFDCSMLAADCAVAVCGKDPAAEYRGKYESEIGAARALLEHGSIADALDRHFERTESAGRGDIAQLAGGGVGVVWGNGVWTMDPERGLGLTTEETKTIWGVE